MILSEMFGEVIHQYTRANAIDDGYLVDVTNAAKEMGFTIPVALTRAAWFDCVEWDDTQATQTKAGRLGDVLYMARNTAQANRDSDRFLFELYVVPQGMTRARIMTLKCLVHGGDNAEPVITIMNPLED